MNLSLIESLQKISDDIPIKNEWLWNQRYIFYKITLKIDTNITKHTTGTPNIYTC